MTNLRFTKLLAAFAAAAAIAARDASDLAELDPTGEVDSKTVLAATNKLREQLLWIERGSI